VDPAVEPNEVEEPEEGLEDEEDEEDLVHADDNEDGSVQEAEEELQQVQEPSAGVAACGRGRGRGRGRAQAAAAPVAAEGAAEPPRSKYKWVDIDDHIFTARAEWTDSIPTQRHPAWPPRSTTSRPTATPVTGCATSFAMCGRLPKVCASLRTTCAKAITPFVIMFGLTVSHPCQCYTNGLKASSGFGLLCIL